MPLKLIVHNYEADILAEVWKILPGFLIDLDYLVAKIQEEINQK